MNKKIIISSLLVIFSLVVGFTAMADTNNYNSVNKDSASIIVGPGQHCGGNIANAPRCGEGYHCGPVAGQTLPLGDVGGICIADSDQQNNINKQNDNNAQDNNNQDNNAQENSNQINGQEHRSAVATFVQSLLNLADNRQGGIGDQVRAIAKAQNDSKDNVANEIDKIKNRNGLKTFLIGTDYKNIGQLRSEMVTTGNQIDQLTTLLGQTTVASDKITIQAQIDALKLQQQKINDFIKANESKFSLLGWLVKLFNK